VGEKDESSLACNITDPQVNTPNQSTTVPCQHPLQDEHNEIDNTPVPPIYSARIFFRTSNFLSHAPWYIIRGCIAYFTTQIIIQLNHA
jgi:hypothetical protein